MKEILSAPFVRDLANTAANMYRLGWDERNGGNISYLLREKEVGEYLDLRHVQRRVPIGFSAEALAEKLFLITGTGKYFKNIAKDPEDALGIVRIGADGRTAELLWGFRGDGWCTSEFPAHMMSHMARLRVDPQNRVVMHCHPTYTLAMTHVHEMDERTVTRTLWRMYTESIIVFPDGVGTLPWMLCGTREIGEATAKKLEEFRLVIWTLHGIYGAGRSFDEAFGLIETVEKAAQLYLLTAGLPEVNTISDRQLQSIAEAFGGKYRRDFLDL